MVEFADLLHSVPPKELRQSPFRCEGETDQTGSEFRE